jgi:hypothetical protein
LPEPDEADERRSIDPQKRMPISVPLFVQTIQRFLRSENEQESCPVSVCPDAHRFDAALGLRPGGHPAAGN